MRDENIRLQREREEAALLQRSEIRASMGLGEGVGIDIVDVVETNNLDKLQDPVQSEDSAEISLQSACDSADSPTQLCLSVETSCVSSSQNVSDTTAVSDSNYSNNKCEGDSLCSHGYGTRKKQLLFRQMHLGLLK